MSRPSSGDPLAGLTHVVLFDYPLPFPGGISAMATWIACHLKQRGYRTVLAGNRAYLSDDLYRGLELELYPLDRIIRRGMWSDARLVNLYVRLRRRFGPDVLLYPMLINYVKIAASLPALARWRIASFLHGNETLRLLRKRPGTLQRSLLRCTRVFADSGYTAGLVREPLEVDNVSVLWPGIRYDDLQRFDPELRRRRGWADREVILMLSRLAGRKGHRTVLEAVRRLRARRPEVLLVIGGSGPMRQEIETRARDMDLTAHVELLGYVEEHDKASLYRAADVYCMPSDAPHGRDDVEGFGITFLEAAACGTLSIGSRTGGIPEALDGGATGLLVPPSDPETLAAVLDDVLSEPGRYESMRKRARRRAESVFDWPARVEAMVEILRDAAAGV